MRLGVRGKLFLVFTGVVLVAVAVAGVTLSGALKDHLNANVEAELGRHAETGALLVEARRRAQGDALSYDDLAKEMGEATDARVTVILNNGVVVGDSKIPSGEVGDMENHGKRPEIRSALEQGAGLSRRYSTTLEDGMLYVARRFDAGDGAVGVVRVSKSLEEVDQAVAALYGLLAVSGLVGLALALLMGGISSHYFTRALRTLLEYAHTAVEGARRPAPLDSKDELGGLAISVQKLAEELEERLEELAQERNRFGAVLEGMSEAVIALDEYRRVTLINDAGIHLLGVGEQPIGKTILETIRVPELNDLLNQVEPGKEARIEFDFGASIRRRVLATASRRAAGDYVIVFLDVTELRRLEGLRRDFVSNVSHELRTPVSVLRANAETLLGGAMDDPEAAPRFLRSIMVNAERLSNLISDLLDISRIEEGKYRLDLEEVPLSLSLRRAAAALETEAIGRGMSVKIEACGEQRVRADVKALDQVLFNLLDNAVKYTQDGGNVILRAAEGEGAVRIEVEDDGPGVEPRFRGRLFERFFRVDKGRSREMGGTGLGLSIVKHLVSAMDGTVGMVPARTGGSVFWLELPKAG